MYAHQFIWLRSNSSGVIGINPEDMNDYIREYNRGAFHYIDFWTWLEYEKDIAAHGFDCLWNEGNPNMSKLAIIKHCLADSL